jgi:outer membrane protein assembly factor BamB
MGGDWRQFRGSDGTSVSDESGLPASFDLPSGRNVAWQAALPGRGPSSPIVVRGRVVVTAADGPRQEQLDVLCFDAASGRRLWQRQLWATGSTVVSAFGGVASPTPASDGRRIFALFSSNDLACFDLDGNLLWYRGLGLESPNTRNDVGMACSPLAIGQTVVVQLDNQGEAFVAGLDAASGADRWRLPREHDALWSSPTRLRAAPGGEVLLLQARTRLSAHDPRTGGQVWDFPAMVDTISSVTTCGENIYLPAVGLHRLQCQAGGRGVTPLWYQQRLRLDNPSPVACADGVYFIKPPGILVCCRTSDGHPAWQLRLRGPIWATPVLAQRRLYVVSYEGLVQVVALGPDVNTAGKIVGGGQLEEGLLASPAVTDGAIFFRSHAHLWKIAETKR